MSLSDMKTLIKHYFLLFFLYVSFWSFFSILLRLLYLWIFQRHMHGPFNNGPRWITVNTGLLFHVIFVIIIFYVSEFTKYSICWSGLWERRILVQERRSKLMYLCTYWYECHIFKLVPVHWVFFWTCCIFCP